MFIIATREADDNACGGITVLVEYRNEKGNHE
jgi:hypothetical protein